MKWYLIEVDNGIIDEAEKKSILMDKHNFTDSHRWGKGYFVERDADYGIDGNYWIIKESDLKKTWFEKLLKEYKENKE